MPSAGNSFDLRKAPLGRKTGSVTVSDGTVVLRHPKLKRAAVVPITQIAGMVDLRAETQVEPERPVMLHRAVRAFNFVMAPIRFPNVVLVLRSPARIGTFKYGAHNVLAIRPGERRSEIEADIVGVDADDAAGLMRALRANGVPTSTSVVGLTREVVGDATGPEVERGLQEIRRATTRDVGKATVLALGLVALLSARLLGGEGVLEDLPLAGRAIAASLAGAVLLGGLVSLLLRRPATGAERPRRTMLLLGLAPLLVIAALLLFRANVLASVGVPFILSHALVGAAIGGVWLGIVWRPPPDLGLGAEPIVTGSGNRHRLRIGAAIVGVAVIAGLAVTEPGSYADLQLARSAVMTEDDLPAGWAACCGAGVFRGAELDQHICGSTDDLPPKTAGYQRTFVLEPGGLGRPVGRMTATVVVAPTVDAAEREFAAVDSPGYLECTERRVLSDALPADLEVIGEPTVTHTRIRELTGPSTVADRFVIAFRSVEGDWVTSTTFVRMQVGRAIVRLPITTYDVSIEDEPLDLIIDAAAEEASGAFVP